LYHLDSQYITPWFDTGTRGLSDTKLIRPVTRFKKSCSAGKAKSKPRSNTTIKALEKVLLTASIFEKIYDASVCGTDADKENLRSIVTAVAMSVKAALRLSTWYAYSI